MSQIYSIIQYSFVIYLLSLSNAAVLNLTVPQAIQHVGQQAIQHAGQPSIQHVGQQSIQQVVSNPLAVINNNVNSVPSTQKMVALKFIVINVDSEKRLGNFSSFKLNGPVWFDVILPSIEVELVLMFNSSSKNDKEIPIFDVKGTFCLQNETKTLFSGLKGPVSKMISRQDLLSLKARTECNLSFVGEKPRVYLNAIPTTKLTNSTGTIYAFLLHNQTRAVEPIIKAVNVVKVLNTSTQIHKNTPNKSTTSPAISQNIQNSTVQRVKRDSQTNQSSIISSNLTETKSSNSSIVTSNQSLKQMNAFSKWYNFSNHADKLRLTLIENGKIRLDCNATISIQPNGCNSTNHTIINENLTVDLNLIFKGCNKSNGIQVNVNPMCLHPNASIELTVVGLLNEKQHWYQKAIFIKWIPIGICLFFVIWVGGCYASLLINRHSQINRHSFQRNTVLQRTNSDPAPRRTMSNGEVVPQARWN